MSVEAAKTSRLLSRSTKLCICKRQLRLTTSETQLHCAVESPTAACDTRADCVAACVGAGCVTAWMSSDGPRAPVLVCLLQTCQTTAVPGAAEEAGAFRSRQHQTYHAEPAEEGQDAH